MNKKNLRQNGTKGITLIALIITIIVMLILVAVTITVAVNGGLFTAAGRAGKETQDAIKAEQELADGKIKVGDDWYTSIDDYLNNNPIPKVGDYVNYTPDAGTYTVASGPTGSGFVANQTYKTEVDDTEAETRALKWRILSIDEETGEIEIVSATAAQTSKRLYLSGADGYNHAVDILNDLCETLYSKTVNGTKVATGRSINVKDINSKTRYSPIGEKNTSTGFTYKDTKQLSEYGASYMNYPNLYSQEIGYGTAGTFNTTGLDEETGVKNGTTENGVTTYPEMGYTDGNTEGTYPYVTHTYYGYDGSSFTYYPEQCLDTSLGINTAPTGLINLDTTYWLASRCVNALSSYAYFCVRYVNSSGYVSNCNLFYSGAAPLYPGGAVRPVVSLGTNVSLTKDDENSNESVTYWNIEF